MAKHPTKRVACEAVFPGPRTLPRGRSSFLGHPGASISRGSQVRSREEPFPASARREERRVDLLGLLVDARSDLLELSVTLGLEVVGRMLEEDRTRLCGRKGYPDPDRQATRYGYDDGSVVLGGRRVAVCKPRVRSIVLMAPHAVRFTDEALARVAIPVLVYAAENDDLTRTQYHGERLARTEVVDAKAASGELDHVRVDRRVVTTEVYMLVLDLFDLVVDVRGVRGVVRRHPRQAITRAASELHLRGGSRARRGAALTTALISG